jgi:predicted methyltransferase
MVSRSRVSAFGLVLGTALLAQACAQPVRPVATVAREQCRHRIIVSFSGAADAATVAALAAAAGVKLTIVSRLMPGTYVLDLAAAGPDSACDAGLARVRTDARVRAAEPDKRRGPNAG